MNRDYADDCIHLKACRRICKFHNINNRGCRADYCTAYESKDDFLDNIEDVPFENLPVQAWMFG